jgi:hypothetical protein
MKKIHSSVIVFLASIAPAIAADTTGRMESLPDANPECMQVNGPDCVLRSEFAPPRVTAPPATTTPSGVVGMPAPATPGTTTIAPGSATVIAPAAPATNSTVISPRR